MNYTSLSALSSERPRAAASQTWRRTRGRGFTAPRRPQRFLLKTALLCGCLSSSSLGLAQGSPGQVTSLEFAPGKGLGAKSADGNFSLNIGLRNQLRFTLENRTESNEELDATASFQIPRSRIVLKGNAFAPKVKYEVQLDVAPRGMSASASGAPQTSPLLDAAFQFEHLRDLSLRAGQYSAPFLREQLKGDARVSLVDRSLIHSRFNLDRDLGVDFYSNDLFGWDEQLRYSAGVFTGEGRNSFEQQSLGFLYLARVEVLPLGSFDHYTDTDFSGGKPRLSLGAAYGYHQKAQRAQGTRGAVFADGGSADYHLATADLAFKAWGFGLQAAFVWRDGERSPGSALDGAGQPIPESPASNGIGLMGQLGYLVPSTQLELVGRYSMVKQGDEPSSLKSEREAGGGLSYYFSKHDLKIQTDFIRIWDQDQEPRSKNNQFRAQLQFSL